MKRTGKAVELSRTRRQHSHDGRTRFPNSGVIHSRDDSRSACICSQLQQLVFGISAGVVTAQQPTLAELQQHSARVPFGTIIAIETAIVIADRRYITRRTLRKKVSLIISRTFLLNFKTVVTHTVRTGQDFDRSETENFTNFP